MCGILGWLSNAAVAPGGPEAQAVGQGLAQLRARGPDAAVIQTLSGAVLGHARLSILDLREVANQPMTDPTGRYWLVFNGEVFNFEALRGPLEAAGVRFETRSDSEVVLHHLIRNGPEGVRDLNGFFALCLYDTQTQTAWLFRDPYGIKPLVYLADASGVRFASEAKALVAMGYTPELAREQLGLYFQLNYLPPDRSLLAGVRHVPPGHWLAVTRGAAQPPQAYYKLPSPGEQRTSIAAAYPERLRQLEALLEDAVRLRLISDVPLGVFLSGGIDSSVIATLARRHTPHLQTFSIGFEEAIWDETAYAQAVARKLGTEHTVFLLNAGHLFAHLEGVLDYLSEPFADASALNVYILSQETRKHVTVALSGDGADEVFGGYHRHVADSFAASASWAGPLARLAQLGLGALSSNRGTRMGRRVFQLRKLARLLALGPEARYRYLASVAEPEAVAALLTVPFDPDLGWGPYLALRGSEAGVGGFLRADIALVLAGDMLPKVDLMSMAHSLEVRPPFLDPRVVDFAAQLPETDKVRGRLRKRILQDAFRPYLPPELYNRPKQGFEVPLRGWFLTQLRSRIETEYLNREFVQDQGLFSYPGLERLWAAVQRGEGKADWTLWAYIVFQHWYKRYWA